MSQIFWKDGQPSVFNSQSGKVEMLATIRRDNNGKVLGFDAPDGQQPEDLLPGYARSANKPATDGIGFNGGIVDMDETPNVTNTADYPVGTLFISPAE